MTDKIICEKCGKEMIPVNPEKPVGMKCPNCGWGWITSYIEPIVEDETIYEVTLEAGNNATRETIKAVSEIAGVNYIEARQLINNSPSVILSDKAVIIRDSIIKLGAKGLKYKVEPVFPYEV